MIRRDPSEHLFKMRAPMDGQIVAKIPNSALLASPAKGRRCERQVGRATSLGDTGGDVSLAAGRIALRGRRHANSWTGPAV